MTAAFPRSHPLADTVAHATTLALTNLQPRRSLHLADKQADWQEALTTLQHFAASPGYQAPLQF